MPVITRPPVALRAFRDEDVGLVQSVAGDPLIPLITTVPASGNASDARAYIGRARGREPPHQIACQRHRLRMHHDDPDLRGLGGRGRPRAPAGGEQHEKQRARER